MRNFKSILSISAVSATLILSSFTNANKPERDYLLLVKETNHNNFTIALDLSNRVKGNLQVQDVELIQAMINSFDTKIIKSGNRLVQQNDQIRISSINPAVAKNLNISEDDLTLDLSRFGHKQMERIRYLKGADYQNDIAKIESKVKGIYSNVKQGNTLGADIFSYLKKVSTLESNPEIVTKRAGKYLYEHHYNNVLILMTDGYIEYGKYDCSSDQKVCPFLSEKKVKEFRNAFNASGKDDFKQFFKESGYGITPVKNPNLQNLKIVVSQMEDRSIKNGNATVFPTDGEILQLFWEDWLYKSGVKKKNMRFIQTASSVNTAVDQMLFFEN